MRIKKKIFQFKRKRSISFDPEKFYVVLFWVKNKYIPKLNEWNLLNWHKRHNDRPNQTKMYFEKNNDYGFF